MRMNLLFRLLILSILILTLGRALANVFFDDPEIAERMVKMSLIVAVIYVPFRHFRLKRKFKK